MAIKIPLLTARDVEVRIAQTFPKGAAEPTNATLLLYKDARCDMKILDAVFGIYGWQRKHELIGNNLYCTVSVWDEDKKIWISKQDVGTKSNTEADKGQASDSFKRACFNLGIGRELYNAPFIYVSIGSKYDKFEVTELEYDVQQEQFTKLTIVNFKTKKVVYNLGPRIKQESEPLQQQKAKKVRIEDDAKGDRACLVQSTNGKYYDIRMLPIDSLMQLMAQNEYQEAFKYIGLEIDRRNAN